MVAVAVIGSAVVGAGATIAGSSMAANAQKKAAQSASNTQMSMFNKMQENLQPYMDLGQTATGIMSNKIGDYLAPVTMDQATLEKTPGYQFNLTQGLKAVQNSAAARGLGSSGAALKGAANFATGLADNTYQNQFNNAVTNQTNSYNRLMGVLGIGQNAAAGVGNAGVQTGNSIAQNTIGAGNAQAGAYMSGANAISGAANNIGGYYAYKGLYGGGGSGNGNSLGGF